MSQKRKYTGPVETLKGTTALTRRHPTNDKWILIQLDFPKRLEDKTNPLCFSWHPFLRKHFNKVLTRGLS